MSADGADNRKREIVLVALSGHDTERERCLALAREGASLILLQVKNENHALSDATLSLQTEIEAAGAISLALLWPGEAAEAAEALEALADMIKSAFVRLDRAWLPESNSTALAIAAWLETLPRDLRPKVVDFE